MLILLIEKLFMWISERAEGKPTHFEKIDDDDDDEPVVELRSIDELEADGDESVKAMVADQEMHAGEHSVNGQGRGPARKAKAGRASGHSHSHGHAHSHGLPVNVESPLLPYILTIGGAVHTPSPHSVQLIFGPIR